MCWGRQSLQPQTTSATSFTDTATGGAQPLAIVPRLHEPQCMGAFCAPVLLGFDLYWVGPTSAALTSILCAPGSTLVVRMLQGTRVLQ